VSLGLPHFGKEGAPPVVCFQHFTGTMKNFDPIHTNRFSARPPGDPGHYRWSVARVARCRTRCPLPRPTSSPSSRRSAEGDRSVRFLDRRHVASRWCLTRPNWYGASSSQAPGRRRRRHAEIYAQGDGNRQIVRTAPSRNAPLDLFFSKSPTSYAAGKAWLTRIAARKLDREPEAKPQVGEAQLVALAKWGAIPATDRYGDLKKIKQRTLVVNGKDDIMVPTINSYILQQHLPDARLILYRIPGTARISSFSKSSPKRPPASSPRLEPKAAAVNSRTHSQAAFAPRKNCPRTGRDGGL